MTMENVNRSGTTSDVPEVVIMRLPQYLRVLARLSQRGVEVVNSQQLGQLIQMTPAQIRKDLSHFGRFGKQSRGYNVARLLDELRQILGLGRDWKVGLVGVGRLGRSILEYPGFAPEGFKIAAAFDADPMVVGQVVGGIVVQPMSRLQEIIPGEGIRICVVAVPAVHAQNVINELVACDVQAIANYAPINAQVPSHVKVRSIDPVVALQSMTYYVQTSEDASSPKKTRR